MVTASISIADMVSQMYHSSYLSSLTIIALLSTASGSPILRLDTCSEFEVNFTCTVNRTELLWEIDFSRGPAIAPIRVRYFSDDTIASSRMNIVTDSLRATAYIFYLVSTSPLISTMSANASKDLYGATVTCRDGFTNAALEDAIIMCGPPKPNNVSFTANLKSEIAPESVVEAFLQWNVSAYDCNRYYVIGNLEYFVTIWPPLLDGSTLYSDSTSNKSLALSLTYDQEYSIAVITANCVGNSTPANISIGQCPVSQLTNTSFKVEYSKSIVGDQTIFTCQSGLEPQEKMNATCRNSGNRTTNTADVICSNHSEGTINEGGDSDVVTTYATTNAPRQTSNLTITVITASLGSVFLVVLITTSVIIALSFMLYKHRRKQRTLIVERNQYIEVEHGLQQYQELYTRLEPPPLPSESQNSTLVPTLSQLEVQTEEADHEVDADKTVNLDSLLIQLRLQVTPKWHQFGVAVGIPDEILEQYSSYSADEGLIEVLDYWLKYSGTPTWRDVAKVLNDIELHELAEGIMNVYETGFLPIEVDVDDSDSDDNVLLPLPLPSNMLSTTDNDYYN